MNQDIESVERWANYVKQSKGKWKKIHTKFINAQYEKQREFIKKIPREKIIKLYRLKNLKGYPKLLN